MKVLGKFMCEKNGKYMEVNDCCYEISLMYNRLMECPGYLYLSMDTIREQVFYDLSPLFCSFQTVTFTITSSHAMTDGFPSDYCDGESFCENKLKQTQVLSKFSCTTMKWKSLPL